MSKVPHGVSIKQFPAPAANHSVAVLTSWKDIAKYLGKGVRTAQRWEKELGLPVRRRKHARKSAVLAIPSEINDWVSSQRIPGGRVVESVDKTTLVRQIQELQTENLELLHEIDKAQPRSA